MTLAAHLSRADASRIRICEERAMTSTDEGTQPAAVGAPAAAPGWLGLAVAAFAFYLSLAVVREASYGREVLPVGHLAKA
jgi:hypothetical protein